MRISDWSSDVCSSDLFQPLGAEFTRLVAGFGLFGAIVRRDLVERDREEARAKGAVDDDPAVVVGHFGAPGLGKLREHPGEISGAAPEMGRWALRERGCK